jgi:hypothetical protein
MAMARLAWTASELSFTTGLPSTIIPQKPLRDNGSKRCRDAACLVLSRFNCHIHSQMGDQAIANIKPLELEAMKAA